MSASNIKKIVVIGPESTGKSYLCESLSKHYQTIWCPEYAREYLLSNGTNYTNVDLLTIAKGQIQLEEDLVRQINSADKLIPYFIDTDMYVMKVWNEFVFQQCHKFILDQIVHRQYDAYLLCKPDIPWVKDELREYPDEAVRIQLYHHYKDAMTHQSLPWVEISGDYQQRLEMAVRFTDRLLSL
jgi:NadR type nicotinamide-nucleotide adenylyltransferase